MNLFNLEVKKPKDTNYIKYITFGYTFKKDNFKCFEKEINELLDIKLDSATYSRMVLEASIIDGVPYFEISTNSEIFIPIAGRQVSILKLDAKYNNQSFCGYIDTINFILNDIRLYSKSNYICHLRF